MAGGGGGGTTTTQVDARFNPIIDYMTQAAGKVNNAGYTPYTGQRYSDLNDTQQQGIDMVKQRAMGGDPTMNQATQTLQNTLKGGQTNPYLDSMVQKAQAGVMSNLGAIQARSGSFGNSGVIQTGAQQMGDIASQMYGNAYNTDRANQMMALGMAPQYADQSYKDASQLLNVGALQQSKDQQNKDFQYQQFQDQQNTPYKQMAAYSGLLGSGAGSKTTTESGGK